MKSEILSYSALLFLLLPLLFIGCRKDEIIVPSTITDTGNAIDTNEYKGLYLLNEGNMGSNKASLDYYDFSTGKYFKNIYAERNPNVTLELGDVGNDIGIYGSKLYLVINASNKVEILDAKTAKRIKKIDIPNCRYLLFQNGKVYVSSYVGPIKSDPEAPRGAVYCIDTASLSIEKTVTVGYQPEMMVADNDNLYVANSGGYRLPDYDNTISVVDLKTFTEKRKIPVAINLFALVRDNHDQLWVSSRGDYKDVHSNIIVLERDKEKQYQPTDTLNIPASNFALWGDSLYYYASAWSNETQSYSIAYGIIDVKTHKKIVDSFIDPSVEKSIQTPYGIAVYQKAGLIFICDAKDYTSSGELFIFDRQGRLKTKISTGDIPGHIAFLK